MRLEDVFRDINRRHGEASAVNDLKKIQEISMEYENLLNQAPGASVILFGLGTCKLQLGLNGSAISYFEQALKELPNSPEIWNNLGSAWKAENQDEKARECFHKAYELKPHADYLNNIATLYVNQGCPSNGMKYCEEALQLDPEHPRIHWNYSLLLLEQGMWKKGFEHYDYGLHSNDRPLRYYHGDMNKVPIWNGERGKVVVYGEQGMGDEIMFASCLPDLIKEADEVVFDCHSRMIGLFQRSFPGLRCHPTRKINEITWPNDEDPPLDYKIAIGSLFGRYRSDGKFPRKAYLKADPVRTEQYRQRLEALGPGPYVGIAWKAGGKKTAGHIRSFKLNQFVPILEKGGTFVSLQYLDEGGKCERFFNETGYRIHHWPEVVESLDNGERGTGYDYDETAALVAALDLCIVPNTTIVHLCGALGKECWTLTPNAAAWRYQLRGRHMPFYGDWVRQYRERNSWDTAFLRVALDYEAFQHRGFARQAVG